MDSEDWKILEEMLDNAIEARDAFIYYIMLKDYNVL